MTDTHTSLGVIRIEDTKDILNLPILICFQGVAMSMEKMLVIDSIAPALRARMNMVDFQQISMFEEQVAEWAFSLLSFEQKCFCS